MKKKLKIILSGGGTGGSVSPLLAIAEELKLSQQEIDFLWLGARKGIEKKMVANIIKEEKSNIKFQAIHNGKLRRYFSLKNFIDPIFIAASFLQSLWIIFKFQPDFIITAGGFVAVPVVWAGWILRVSVLVHQQDVKIGLANKLMAPFATIITCSLEDSIREFKNKRTYFTGNAIRRQILEMGEYWAKGPGPTLLVLGGGTGALAVNTIIVQSLSELTKICDVIHITGGKDRDEALPHLHNSNRYHPYPFLNNIEEELVKADLVISRAGMCFLSELAVLSKPVIIIPIPDSHQEANAKYFANRDAAVILNQKELTPEILISTVREIFEDKNKMRELSENISKIMPSDGASRIAEIVLQEIRN